MSEDVKKQAEVKTEIKAEEKKESQGIDETKKDTTILTDIKKDSIIVPEKYNLTLPEGTILDPSVIDKISTKAKEKGLSNDAAQELLNGEISAINDHNSRVESMVETAKKTWVEKSMKDPEIGGEKFKENLEISKKGFTRFVTPELQRILDISGMGNHPEVIRLFYKIESLIEKSQANDKFVKGDNINTAKEKTTSEKLYGN